MIKYATGDILEDSGVKAIPVNIRGIAGAGLARQFRDRFPNHVKEYVNMCRQRQLKMGYPMLSYDHSFAYFPTKDHWMDNSKAEDVQNGLDFLLASLNPKVTGTIAFPMLGTGLGKLPYDDVLAMLQAFGEQFKGTTHIYS